MENHLNNHVLFIIAVLNIYASVSTEYRSFGYGLAELTELKQVYGQPACDGQSRCQYTEGMSLNKAYPRLLFQVTPAFTAMFRDRMGSKLCTTSGTVHWSHFPRQW